MCNASPLHKNILMPETTPTKINLPTVMHTPGSFFHNKSTHKFGQTTC